MPPRYTLPAGNGMSSRSTANYSICNLACAPALPLHTCKLQGCPREVWGQAGQLIISHLVIYKDWLQEGGSTRIVNSARALLQVLLARHSAPRVLEGASHMTGNAALFLFVVGLELGSHYIVLTRLELAR